MGNLNVMIVGGGGREHALAWKLAQSPQVKKLAIAPGNAGTLRHGENVPIPADDVAQLVTYAVENGIGLVVVGPEVPLALGIVDLLTEAGIRAFGPTAAAARLETSKAFAKAFMARHGIPTARHASFSDPESAHAYVDAQAESPLVVKADGLAAGKGVLLCDDRQQAHVAIDRLMVGEAFGKAGRTVVIEERLTGREVSVLAFCDGRNLAVMPPVRDHKRALDGDQGENTGGMGAFTHPADVTPDLLDEIAQRVLRPAVDGMAAEGSPFVGVLYAGVMLTPDGIRTLEFNTRFGDPETQVIVPLLASDLVEVAMACVEGSLDQIELRWQSGVCATVVACAPGYPGAYPTGAPIHGIDDAQALAGVQVFHAGTRQRDGQTLTAGGRVLAVSAIGDRLADALSIAYEGIGRVQFDGIHYRRDIGRTSP